MVKWQVSLFVLLTYLALASPGLAGEIRGEVTIVTKKVPKRATNRNPNRKRVLKKYPPKMVRQACQGGPGGLPRDAVVDERDFAVMYLSSESAGRGLKATPTELEFRQKGRRFLPHVLPIVLGSKVRLSNLDKFFHHLYCPDSSEMNVPEHRADVVRKPSEVGRYEMFCDIHPKENGYIFVVPNDHFAQATQGRFMLLDVPPGEYVLRVWHPRLKGKSYPTRVREDGVSEIRVEL